MGRRQEGASDATPATGAGTLALGLAETFAGLVLGYSVDENAIMSIDFTGGYADMSSLLFSAGSPDRNTLMGAWAQMISTYYGITSAVHGGKQMPANRVFRRVWKRCRVF